MYKEINIKSVHLSKQLRRREHSTEKCRNTLGKISVADSAPVSQAHGWKPLLAPCNTFCTNLLNGPKWHPEEHGDQLYPHRVTLKNKCVILRHKNLLLFLFFSKYFLFLVHVLKSLNIGYPRKKSVSPLFWIRLKV